MTEDWQDILAGDMAPPRSVIMVRITDRLGLIPPKEIFYRTRSFAKADSMARESYGILNPTVNPFNRRRFTSVQQVSEKSHRMASIGRFAWPSRE